VVSGEQNSLNVRMPLLGEKCGIYNKNSKVTRFDHL